MPYTQGSIEFQARDPSIRRAIMIISRSPVRLPLGGGGTDLASYYSQFGGFFVAAAIDKYNYINVKRRFENGFRVSYSKTEITDSVEKIKQPIVREALRLLDVKDYLEIVSIADVPGRSGLGGSSSYAVGVLNALHFFKRENIPRQALAEEACCVEIDVLKEPIGKQDQYVASFGGINSYEIEKDGTVHVTPLVISQHSTAELESNLLLFYTGIKRDASQVLGRQRQDQEKGDKRVIETMHEIKRIGYQVRDSLANGDIRSFGELLDSHWRTKKNLSEQISNSRIDQLYELAMRNGALGGKIMGAGGGGFFMFYSENGKQKLRSAMAKEGSTEVRFRFDFDGSKIILNI
jgi:D-glycero-alpha-D-manno-heptose-7-phosphate kinase